jgi:hypothetical protein
MGIVGLGTPSSKENKSLKKKKLGEKCLLLEP